jgi:hypothetical protein
LPLLIQIRWTLIEHDSQTNGVFSLEEDGANKSVTGAVCDGSTCQGASVTREIEVGFDINQTYEAFAIRLAKEEDFEKRRQLYMMWRQKCAEIGRDRFLGFEGRR